MQEVVNILNSIYSQLGVQGAADAGDLWGLLSVALILVASLKNFLSKAPTSKKIDIGKVESEQESEQKKQAPDAISPKSEVKDKKVSWGERLRKGLSQSHSQVWGKIYAIVGKGIDADVIEEIEELLYGADIGPATVGELIAMLEKEKESINAENFKEVIFAFLKERISPFQGKVHEDVYDFSKKEKGTKTIMIVGVNGVGKTTTIGKLATRLTRQGAKVVVGAGDTFRAAAVEQLQVWCERSGATMIKAPEGSNPSGVAFDAVKTAVSEKADYCIVDTAGRLHTNSNLMQELVKIKEVMSKNDATAPQEVWLVLDAVTGQNAIKQALQFNESLGLTGVIFTKCDGSSKAGSAISIVQQLKVPIIYIGVGEEVDDLDRFQVDDYLGALIDAAPASLS